MTYYRNHPPVYYMIRSIVRFTVWCVLPILVMWGVLVAMSKVNATAPCPIDFNRDFTYTTTEWHPGLDCDLPYNVEIDTNGNWWWAS